MGVLKLILIYYFVSLGIAEVGPTCPAIRLVLEGSLRQLTIRNPKPNLAPFVKDMPELIEYLEFNKNNPYFSLQSAMKYLKARGVSDPNVMEVMQYYLDMLATEISALESFGDKSLELGFHLESYIRKLRRVRASLSDEQKLANELDINITNMRDSISDGNNYQQVVGNLSNYLIGLRTEIAAMMTSKGVLAAEVRLADGAKKLSTRARAAFQIMELRAQKTINILDTKLKQNRITIAQIKKKYPNLISPYFRGQRRQDIIEHIRKRIVFKEFDLVRNTEEGGIAVMEVKSVVDYDKLIAAATSDNNIKALRELQLRKERVFNSIKEQALYQQSVSRILFGSGQARMEINFPRGVSAKLKSDLEDMGYRVYGEVF